MCKGKIKSSSGCAVLIEIAVLYTYIRDAGFLSHLKYFLSVYSSNLLLIKTVHIVQPKLIFFFLESCELHTYQAISMIRGRLYTLIKTSPGLLSFGKAQSAYPTIFDVRQSIVKDT